MTARTLLLSVLTLSLLLGCPAADDDDTGDDDTTPFVPDLPTGGCGAPAYDWVSTERMGEIVDWEVIDEMEWTAVDIGLLAAMAGWDYFSPAPYGLQIYRVRYVTQDRGQEVEATATLLFPDVDTETEFPTLLLLHGYNGSFDACAPSAEVLDGYWFSVAVAVASQGFVTVMPDYLGLNGMGAPAGFPHPAAVAEPSAVASLDSLRALHRFHGGEGDDGILAVPGNRAVIWGSSEGGFVAQFADRYAPGYAPEFDIAANVMGVPSVGGLAELTYVANSGPLATSRTLVSFAAMYVGAQAWYGDQGSLDEILTDEPPYNFASNISDLVTTECGWLYGDWSGVEAPEDVFTTAYIDAAVGEDWDALQPWFCYTQEATIHESVIPRENDTPALMIVAEQDDVVIPDTARAKYDALCAQGYRIEYLECAGSSHEGAVQSVPYVLEWVQGQLAGDALKDPCTITAPVDCTQFGLSD